MELKAVTPAQVADFINTYGPWSGSFLQLPRCLNLELAYHHEIEYWGGYVNNTLVALGSVVLYKLPQDLKYAYCVRGPVVTKPEYLKSILTLLTERYRARALFLRAEPIILNEYKFGSLKPIDMTIGYNYLAKLGGLTGFTKGRDIQPRATLMIDLKEPEAELLKNMHPKTRYNIRLAERKGLTFRWGEMEDFPLFWNCLKNTAARGKFRTHHINYYHELLKGMDKRISAEHKVEAKIGLVEYQGEVLAACLQMIGFGVATYLHGGSVHKYKEFMAPYLMHWRVMQQAKAMGCHTYDWWGIQPQDGSHYEWAGFTRFKLGFGGVRVEYVGTLDKPFAWPTYYLYKLGRFMNLVWLELLGYLQRKISKT